jgi:hypothetical protein
MIDITSVFKMGVLETNVFKIDTCNDDPLLALYNFKDM